MAATSTDRSLQGAFAPLRADNTQFVNSTAGTSPALLVTDNAGAAIRRVKVKNLHATQDIAVCLVRRGASVAALTTSSGWLLKPGAEETWTVDADSNVALVASGASTTFTAMVSDV
jgi:hypothetical protein